MMFLVVSTPRPERPSEVASGLGLPGTKHEVSVGTSMLAWGAARLPFSTLKITMYFIKSLMSGRISSLHISILIR